MDINVARHVIRVNFRCSRELQDLMLLLKQQLPESEYKEYARAISNGIAAIGDALTNKVVQTHPKLESEIEESMVKFDRYL